jgi:hypothetical protein
MGWGASAMRHYRVYFVSDDGHISAPAHVIECEDDQEAIGKATQLTDGKPVELWQGARLIARFSRDED